MRDEASRARLALALACARLQLDSTSASNICSAATAAAAAAVVGQDYLQNTEETPRRNDGASSSSRRRGASTFFRALTQVMPTTVGRAEAGLSSTAALGAHTITFLRLLAKQRSLQGADAEAAAVFVDKMLVSSRGGGAAVGEFCDQLCLLIIGEGGHPQFFAAVMRVLLTKRKRPLAWGRSLLLALLRRLESILPTESLDAHYAVFHGLSLVRVILATQLSLSCAGGDVEVAVAALHQRLSTQGWDTAAAFLGKLFLRGPQGCTGHP